MKNSIYIDVDTEREQPILIGKGADTVQPETPEGALEMIKTDISCLCEAMCSLVHVADQNGYGSKEQYVTGLIARLNEFLLEVPPVEEPTDAPQTDIPNNTPPEESAQ